VVASKKSDDTDTEHLVGAVMYDTIFGTHTSATVEGAQLVKASVVAAPGAQGHTTVVRATFQRVVWDVSSRISRAEPVTDTAAYRKFYDGLSKALSLQAHEI